MKDNFRRDLYWLCQRYLPHETREGRAAARLMAGYPHHMDPTDLKVVLDKVWEVNDFGFYTSSLRAQGAALRIEDRMKKGVA